jgi:fructose-1,6-bisphosphatase/inositol monophosphatase family enzyme
MQLHGGQWQRELDVAVEAARAAGAIIKHGFQGKKAVEEKKNASDLVTETDVKVSTMLP